LETACEKPVTRRSTYEVHRRSFSSFASSTTSDTHYSKRDPRRMPLQHVLQSRPYNVFTMILSVVFLVGPDVFFVVSDGRFKRNVRVSYLVLVLCFFACLDVAFQSFAHPKTYLRFEVGKNGSLWVRLGSFMFWCDVTSMLAMLALLINNTYDIIPRMQKTIMVDAMGAPIFRSEKFITICFPKIAFFATQSLQMLRIDRFIRSAAVVWSRCDGVDQTSKKSIIIPARPVEIKRDNVIKISNHGSKNRRVSFSENNNNIPEEVVGGSHGKSVSVSNRPSLRRSHKSKKSRVGAAMHEITGRRVPLFVIFMVFCTMVLTEREKDATMPAMMVMMHDLTRHEVYGEQVVISCSQHESLYRYQHLLVDGTDKEFKFASNIDASKLRPREKIQISVEDPDGFVSRGFFSLREEIRYSSLVDFLSVIFTTIVWSFGVHAFVAPVMTLVVTPIEQMMHFLQMLMKDPLGYQSSELYKKFQLDNEMESIKSKWSKEVLEGMETSFLMSTIVRMGSLLKVGFGSAGAEIIRNYLERSRSSKANLQLNTCGSTISSIFLFCDIRNFTDITESLQEEVFVFTNK